MIKIMAIGDPHSKRNNQSEITECGNKISENIKTHKPKAVVILGDLANDHEKVYLTALNGIIKFMSKVCDAASEVGARVYYIIGNHDAATNQIFLDDSHAFNAFKKWQNLVIIDKPLRLKSDDGYITMCPYVPPGRFVEALDTIGREKWMESMVIFCHQEFDGAVFNGISSKNGDKWGVLLPLVISGHIHGFHTPQNNLIYVGAPYDINFGDGSDGEKTISLFSFENGAVVDHERINLGLLRKIDINLTISEAYEYVPSGKLNIRMHITGTTQEFAKFKASEKFQELLKVAKIVPHLTDPVKTFKNVNRKGYLDILVEECKKENEFVQQVLHEIFSSNEDGNEA
jgi:DNA repair exonuclease SbcCD nuclease subunit